VNGANAALYQCTQRFKISERLLGKKQEETNLTKKSNVDEALLAKVQAIALQSCLKYIPVFISAIHLNRVKLSLVFSLWGGKKKSIMLLQPLK